MWLVYNMSVFRVGLSRPLSTLGRTNKMGILRLANWRVLPMLAMLPLVGCDFGNVPESTTTTSPSVEQVNRCRNIMYIDPKLEIESLGHCHDYGFQDDAIHFKFRTTTDSISSIFQPKYVSHEKFIARQLMSPPRYGLAAEWWDAKQSLLGGDFIVPDPRTKGDRGLNIAIMQTGDKTFVVFCSWHET